MRWLSGALSSLLGALAMVLLAMGVSTLMGNSYSSESARKFAPGVHAIMRHATAPGAGDPKAFDLRRCETQRNLSTQGRDEAAMIGEYLRNRPFHFTAVHTSQWCRSKETAQLLGLGPGQELPALNSFFNDDSTQEQQTRELKNFLIQLGPRDKVLLVTHQVNITALTGLYPQPGEIVFFTIQPTGKVTVVDRLKPAEMGRRG